MKIHTTALTLRIPKELKTQLTKLAKQSRQHRSTLVREILEKAVKKSTLAVLAFVALLLLCVAPAQAQSFKETLGWMHQSSEYHAFFDATDNALESTQVPLTNTCTNFVIIQERSAARQPPYTYKILLNLKAVDPNTVYATAVKDKSWAYIDIGTTNDEEAIQISSTPATPMVTTGTAGVSVKFEDTSFAGRFAKALRHAVVLCGGKPSRAE